MAIIRRWQELHNTYFTGLLDDGTIEATLLIDKCKRIRRVNGVVYDQRKTLTMALFGESQHEIDDKVAAFAERDDVVLLQDESDEGESDA